MEYKQLYDGDSLAFSMRGAIHYFKCCDCGLVHKLHVRIAQHERQKVIKITLWQDKRKTAAGRRSKCKIK